MGLFPPSWFRAQRMWCSVQIADTDRSLQIPFGIAYQNQAIRKDDSKRGDRRMDDEIANRTSGGDPKINRDPFADNPMLGHPSSPSRVRFAAHNTRAPLTGSGRMTRSPSYQRKGQIAQSNMF